MNTRPATYLYACMPCSCSFEQTYPVKEPAMVETPTPPPAPDPAPAPQPDPTTPAPSPTQPT